MKKKQKKWVRFRHRVVRNVAVGLIAIYVRLKYRVKINKFKNKEKRQYLILMNHQTGIDQFLVGMAVKSPVYYVTSEDLFSNGFVSKLLRWAVAPIPIKKQATDTRAVLNCMRVAKEGGTIAIFPEGNRTYSGKTEYIKPAIVGLIKSLKLPVAVMTLKGGYGAHPRWSDKARKGKMTLGVTKIIERDEYAKLSDNEFYNLICDELFVNDCVSGVEYKSKAPAEYMERALYVCPRCGLAVLHSDKDTITCTKCGMQAKYLPNLTLEGVDEQFPFRYTHEWYDYQSEFIHNLDINALENERLFLDKADLYEVILYKKKQPLAQGVSLSLYANKVEVNTGTESFTMPFDKVHAVSVLGRNKLNIYYDNKVYQIKGEPRFNAVKFVQLFYHYKNVMKGEENGKFLGL